MLNIKEEKKIIMDKLYLLKSRVERVNEHFDLDLRELNNKVNTTINNVKNDKFSIAFFGAFSDGKSTILSALIDNLDIEISPEPKTDRVATYSYDDYLIIDTPGLFSENTIHDEITKNYISEANVVIYTLDPVNPLKESHRPTLKWLLSDIDKLESTIFVINKMDAVADIEDEQDFLNHSNIKSRVVYDEIFKSIGKTPENIVCVAADPYQEGYGYWRENLDEYNELSRMTVLRKKIDNFILEYKDSLTVKVGISVIKETIITLEEELSNLEKALENERELLLNQCKETKNRLKTLNKDIERSHEMINEEIIDLRRNTILEFKTVQSSEDLAEVVDLEIGKDAYLLENKINSIIRRHTIDLRDEIEGIYHSIDNTFDYYSNLNEKLLSNIGKGAQTVLKGLLSAPTRKIADSILKIRNTLKITFKFKPWGSVKLAKIMKGLPLLSEVLGLAFGVFTSYKLNKNITEITTSLKDAFDQLIRDELTCDKYKEAYFPEVLELDKLADELNNNIDGLKQVSCDLRGIKKILKSDNYL